MRIRNGSWRDLKEAIGNPDGLTFCTHCGQAVMHGSVRFFHMQSTESACDTLYRISRKGIQVKFFMIIYGHQHTVGTLICLRSNGYSKA
jgi:hypothetical protein